ncbi:biotin--[acetyl-CoA-carboxylase] ligase [Mammaliicoccus stepanovicii]|uniref:Bifunctional ligase/repressor BirA n=1 Tax=Mammaliicoccus stepanovicii TaxID=643214 RepID=A0A239Z9H2_9STAP|nr:biotin--[acetyl-CoA-carboxylase] ligase [Mammaliicoccus stepanovicii]PNZ72657.1 biotin--[acetyl-CoA-carboxylase] ligase [Mammaliicoccus stepanovicii]GGI39824.1 bifunctional ligase/repressor BirA [Mammaliicoccus stepanovicii]SNV67633.1 Biotin-protein ligase / Biotin operon repressor [Mammaliicoccus stepanovicii]
MSKFKSEIIKCLYKNDEYISGQYIAEKLNCSRVTIKKVIDQLKHEGFNIESQTNKGYKITQLPPLWQQEIVNIELSKQKILNKAYVQPQVDSTQLLARSIINEEHDDFVVLSDEQTKGRGRFNREWSSIKGKGLWMSIVLKPHIPIHKMSTFNLFISLAIQEVVEKHYQINSKIKWPNDIYVGEQKLCGFLTEMIADTDGVNAIICGIGFNLNQTREEFDKVGQHRATSLLIEHGSTIDPYQFLKYLIEAIEKRYNQFLVSPFSEIKDTYKSKSMIWNRTLNYTEGNKKVKGRAIDIQDNGFLTVISEDGEIYQFMSADIDI